MECSDGIDSISLPHFTIKANTQLTSASYFITSHSLHSTNSISPDSSFLRNLLSFQVSVIFLLPPQCHTYYTHLHFFSSLRYGVLNSPLSTPPHKLSRRSSLLSSSLDLRNSFVVSSGLSLGSHFIAVFSILTVGFPTA
ncbi:hypothetical protein BLNAU_10274 [Blattamonas nauphoetae]|uniref:Uncharacterized protein n=1 Tax=Blattamonas nauphoetae TaxID=2049346 RepID=A0ABQ9XTI9_9EUKA|nr:hypothetical protein BLNAU_10274 [Blattamonas nauphoetae]